MPFVKELGALPLFLGIPEARLEQLVAAFRPVKHAAGTVLFRPGDVPTHFEILVEGQVTIEEALPPRVGESTAAVTRFELRPVSTLGELGALTNIPRSTSATAATDIQVYSIGVGDLIGFFDANADVGQAFYKNLLSLVSDKVRRDRRRLEDMRINIIRTQKAMKKMREIVLDANETEISKPIHDTLDLLIDSNRRGNYRVVPTAAYPASVRLDDGKIARVLELSEGYLKIEGSVAEIAKDPSFWAGVLIVPSSEILLSGSVLREGEGGVVLKLDRPIDEYKAKLDDYTTRLQLLDYVV